MRWWRETCAEGCVRRGTSIGAAHGGKQARDPYNIQSVNTFHSGLKRMVNSCFKGGATKYLNWYGFLHAAGEAKRRDLEDLLFEIALAATRYQCSPSPRSSAICSRCLD